MSEDLAAICMTTQETLGKVIEQPDLKKHLKQLEKPPYRFLHDIFTGYIKTTKVFDGYFTEEEMNGGRESDKTKKLAFLQKAIDITSATLGKSISAKPSKIVAGVEPERTNEWLQALAKIHTDGKDWKAAAKKLESKKDDGGEGREHSSKHRSERSSKEGRSEGEKKDRHAEGSSKDRHGEKEGGGSSKDRHGEREGGSSKDRHSKESSSKDDKGKERERDSDKKRSEEKKSSDRKDDDRKKDDKKDDRKDDRKSDRDKRESSSSKKGDEKSPEVPKLPLGEEKKDDKKKHSSSEKKDDKKEPPKEAQPERPSTARKPPPVIKSNVVATESAAVPTEKRKDEQRAANVIVDKKKAGGKGNESESEDEAELPQPFDNTGHEESINAGGTGGGYLSNLGQQDRSVASTAAAPLERQNSGTGIVLARRTKGNQKQSLDAEVKQLREALQTLTKSTNPLGKAMEYVQEDLDSMQRELELWRNETKQQAQAWQDQQRQTQDMLAPLHAQKCDLEDSINDQIDKLNSTKASILRSDAHIENLLRMVVTSANYAR